MRGPDRGSDYRRRLLLETMRGHTLAGHAIARRLRTRPEGAESRAPSKVDDRATERRHATPGDFARS